MLKYIYMFTSNHLKNMFALSMLTVSKPPTFKTEHLLLTVICTVRHQYRLTAFAFDMTMFRALRIVIHFSTVIELLEANILQCF